MDLLKQTHLKSYDSSFDYSHQRPEHEWSERGRAFISRNGSLKYYINLIGLSPKSSQITIVDDTHYQIPS